MAQGSHYFHPVDYVVLVLALTASLGVGIYQSVGKRNVKTTSEYHTGGRLFGSIPVALSLVASFMSSIALIGSPAEAYFFGVQGFLSMFGGLIAGLIVAWLFIPLIHPLGIVSVQEYLELRYKSKTVRLLGTSLSVLKQLLYTGCVVYGQAAALEATTGLSSWISIIVVNVLATIYTAIGGIKAVIWTDVFQVIVMFGSTIVVIIINYTWASREYYLVNVQYVETIPGGQICQKKGLINIGGPAKMFDLSYEWGRLFVSIDPGIYTRLTVWNMVIACVVGWTSTYGVLQTSVQRYCSIADMGQARRSMIGNFVGVVSLSFLCFATGAVVFAFYTDKGCDPYGNGDISNKNQILPYFIMDVLGYPGIPGVFVSGLFCASLSTLSSCISAMCAVIWEDIQRPIFGDNLPPVKQVLVNQITAAMIGMAGLGVTFLVNGVGGSLLQISASLGGLSSGPILGMFVLGALFPWANWKGAMIGSIASLAIVSAIFGGQVVTGTHSVGLPTPTYNCYPNTTMENQTMYEATASTLTSSTLNFLMTTTPAALPEERSFLQTWFFSISYMWFGVIGLFFSLLFGVIGSFLTGPTDPSTVEKRLLFHIIRSRFGKEEDTSIDEKTKKPFLEKEVEISV